MNEGSDLKIFEEKFEQLSTDYSKEGFSSRLAMLDKYKDSVFDAEEYELYRSSELKSIIQNARFSKPLLFITLVLILFSMILFIIGFFNHHLISFVLGGVFIIGAFAMSISLVGFDKASQKMTLGGKQEIINYLLGKGLINTGEAKYLHKKLLDTLAKS